MDLYFEAYGNGWACGRQDAYGEKIGGVRPAPLSLPGDSRQGRRKAGTKERNDMGTRSLTHVYDGDGKTVLLTMYRQYDGYPTGHGAELAEFIAPIEIRNGLPCGDMTAMNPRPAIANGMGCLAAQIVAKFKDAPGHIYIQESGQEGSDEAYIYKVLPPVGPGPFPTGKALLEVVSTWPVRRQIYFGMADQFSGARAEAEESGGRDLA
jgi:hypothetical protein